MTLDAGTVVAPVDMSQELLAAWAVLSDGGYQSVSVTGFADGGFSVAGVNPGEWYLLRWQSNFYLTSDRSPSLGSIVPGRPGVKRISHTTPVSFNFSNLDPWIPGLNALQVVVPNQNLAGQSWGTPLLDGGSIPGDGTTSTAGFSADWQEGLPWDPGSYPAEVESDKGDFILVGQVDSTSGWDGGPGALDIVSKSAILSTITIKDGSSPTLSGSLTPLPMLTGPILTVDPARSMAAQFAPDGGPRNISVGVSGLPGASTWGNYGALSVDDSYSIWIARDSDDVRIPVVYSNPFPDGWELVVRVWSRYGEILRYGSGTQSFVLHGGYYYQDTMSHIRASITPEIGPPLDVQVDGLSVAAPLALSDPSPEVSWRAPTIGTPSFYIVYLWIVDADLPSGGDSFDYLRFFVPADRTRLKIPPGIVRHVNSGGVVVRVSAVLDTVKFFEAGRRRELPYREAMAVGWPISFNL